MELTFNELPKAVTQLFDKLENIEKILLEKSNPSQPDGGDLLTIKEAADFLRLKVPTIYGLVSRSEIPCMKKGKLLYFSKTTLMEWVNTGRKKTIAETANKVDSFLEKRKK